MDISILIVNYKTKDVTRDCLHSVFASKTDIKFEVIVVDNDSGDDSVDMIKKEFPQVILIESKENGGFAKANNLAAKRASGKYVWLLNSDTIVKSNTIQKLFDLAEKNNSYIASCKLLNRDGSLQPQGGALPTALNISTWMLNIDDVTFISNLIPPYQERRKTRFTNQDSLSLNFGWLGGTALLVRRDLYMGMGGLDENIFMYGEDTEFCLRALKGGISVHYFSSPSLTHLGQASGSSERSILGEFAGLKYIFKKHKSNLEYSWLRFMLKVGAFERFILYTLKGNGKQRTTYAKAFTMA